MPGRRRCRRYRLLWGPRFDRRRIWRIKPMTNSPIILYILGSALWVQREGLYGNRGWFLGRLGGGGRSLDTRNPPFKITPFLFPASSVTELTPRFTQSPISMFQTPSMQARSTMTVLGHSTPRSFSTSSSMHGLTSDQRTIKS